MKLYHVVTGLLAGAMVCFISEAEASPHFQAPVFSPLPLQAGLKCGLVNGELKCGNSSGNDQDDDQQGNDDEHHHKKKKNNDDDTGLSECTIQGANSGGGCKGGFKYVCEKLKSGKKCCGCVVDPNAKPANKPAPTGQICCRVSSGGPSVVTVCAETKLEVRAKANAVGDVDGKPPTTILCDE